MRLRRACARPKQAWHDWAAGSAPDADLTIDAARSPLPKPRKPQSAGSQIFSIILFQMVRPAAR